MKQTMPNMTLVKETVCDGCGFPIRIYETEMIGGPKKGEKTYIKPRENVNGTDFGCRCEDIKIAEHAISNKKEAEIKKVKDMFSRYSLINRDLLNATFENYEPKNKSQAIAKRTAERFVDIFSLDKPNNLVFYGGYGVGKSHLAKSITDKVMETKKEGHSRYTAIYISVPKLLRKIRSTYNSDAQVSEDQIYHMLEITDLLVLDDLGSENQSDWAEERLFDLIDSRQGMSTIYTMNFKPEDLMERIGERNFSRVINNDTVILEVKGENYRLKNFKGE